MFITFGLKDRRRIFGKNDRGKIVYSEAGKTALEELSKASKHFSGKILLHKYVIMPDHVHLRISWPAGLENARREIGAYIGRFKQYTHYRIAGRAPSIFADGYHDLICVSAKMHRCIDSYIENNPVKEWLMHGKSDLMRVIEPFKISESDDIWRAVGNAALLDERPLVHLRLSRSLAGAALDAAVNAALDRAALTGCVFVSTFYSPAERRVFEKLAELPAPRMIRLIPTFMDAGYRPHGVETRLFAEKRLFVLSRMRDPEAPPKRAELLELNEVAKRLAAAPCATAPFATAP